MKLFYISLRCGMLCWWGLLAPILLQATPFPTSRPNRFVYDEAAILKQQEIIALNNAVLCINKATTNQIAIVLLPHIEGEDIAAYSVRLGRAWGIGVKDKDNGILLLSALKERRVWISSGNKIEPLLPDITLKRIIERKIVPAFSQGNYYQGLAQAIYAFVEALSKDEGLSPSQQQFYKNFLAHPQSFFSIKGREVAPTKPSMPVWLALLLGIVVFILLIWLLSRINRNNHNNRSGGSRDNMNDALQALALGALLLGGRRGGGGFGGENLGGNFGGGNFGGGGAGGSW